MLVPNFLGVTRAVLGGIGQYTREHDPWIIVNNPWQVAERGLELPRQPIDGAILCFPGDLGVLFSVVSGDQAVNGAQGQLFFADRMLDDSESSVTQEIPTQPLATVEAMPTSIETLTSTTPTVAPTVPETLEPTPMPSEVVAVMTEAPTTIPSDPAPSRNSWLTSIVGPVLIGMIILGIAVVSFRVIRNRQG